MARSFKEFLVESSGLDSGIGSSVYGEYDSYLNEEFKTDEQAITQLQVREYELMRKMSPIREKIRELEKKRSSLMYRIAGMVTNLVDAHVTGEKYTQVEKGYEEAKKELEKIDKELESLYDKIRPYENELAKIRSAVDKMIIRNAKKAGLHPYDYVSKYDLSTRSIRRRMNEDVNINEEFRTDPEAVKQLQAKQAALYDKLAPYYKRIKELESRRDSLMFRMAGIATNLMEFSEKGEKHPEMEATFKKMGKEEDEINKELEKLYPKHDELSAQMQRNQKVISKIIVRNAKKAGIDILQYVSQNDLFHKPR